MPALRYPNSNVDSFGAPHVTFSFRKPGGEQSDLPDIILFMPPAFQINDGQEWEFASKGKIGTIAGLAAGIVSNKDGIAAGIGGALEGALALGADMLGISDAAAQGAGKLGQAVRDPKFFNYKEPKAREFQFNYKFEPKNATDAWSMMQIIRTFRYASYPTALPGGKVYGVPDSVTMNFRFVKTGLEQEETVGLVIKDIATTLSEGEQMTTFVDGTPTQISMNITFAESTLLTKSSSGKLGGDDQGVSNSKPGT